MKNLLLFFNDRNEYQMAKIFFEKESEFSACEYNDEFKCIKFEEYSFLLDALESGIDGELTYHGFDGFYFSAE